MKRSHAPLVLIAAGLCLAQALTVPGPAAAEIERRPQARRPVTVHRDWPLQRRPREVVVHKRKNEKRIRVEPHLFIPPIIFPGVPLLLPPPGVARDRDYRRDDRYDRRRDRRDYYGSHYNRDRLVWEDSETLYHDEDWVEFTLDCNARGEKLWFEIRDGRARLDWAEIVFSNGEAQVVDFTERSLGPGVYPLLDFRDGRRVDHVRFVAKSVGRQVTLILRMEK